MPPPFTLPPDGKNARVRHLALLAGTDFLTAEVLTTLFVLIAEVLEGMTVSRGRRAIRDLLDFLPRTVSVRCVGGVREIDVDELELGDLVLVNPGGRVPVDGTVLSGHSSRPGLFPLRPRV